MAKRYEDAPDHILKTVDEIRDNDFPHLDGANMKVVIDTKKRVTKGRTTLGRMKKANAVEKYLSEDSNGIEIDYVMFLDRMLVEHCDEEDIRRVISHELQHCDYNSESEDPFKIRDHEIQDFFDEIEKNRDDPRWSERAAAVISAAYEQEKEAKKNK